MKSKYFMKSSCILLTILLFCSLTTVYATENTDIKQKIFSINKDTGVTIYRDALGGYVFSGIESSSTTPKDEQNNQQATKDINISNSMKSLNNILPMTNYVDYEYNPVYIGTWNGVAAYARHTLGSYDSSAKQLTSYGYTSWYNVGGNSAVPYRNGATNNGANQGVIDVAKFTYFNIWDMGTGKSTTLKITDWGPTQNSHPDRIADIDKYVFINLHGNSSDGIFYSKTNVTINNYNP